MVYKQLVESVVSLTMIAWYGLLPIKEKQKLCRVVKIGSAIVGKTQRQPIEIYSMRIKKKTHIIIEDCSHALNLKFQLLPSKRCFRQPQVKKCVSNVLCAECH